MRYSPVIFTTFRQAVVDVDLAGVTLPAGTLVIANTAAANSGRRILEGRRR